MTEGTIARITDKGFGFIRIEGVEKDLFFHSTELENIAFDSLQEGDRVQFEIGEGPKGQHATKINKI